ncbi:hypothetical protein ACLGIH_32820 [Streptomyces sp. HMX87]|uniref:hypothetical protein n=1 Tax=Streptomyces sp. HMX87 TaxID=3390849 RepID=UPI003A84D46C
MSITASSTAPIYDRLLDERGDVVAEVQRVAEQTRRQAADVLDFRSQRSVRNPRPGDDSSGE